MKSIFSILLFILCSVISNAQSHSDAGIRSYELGWTQTFGKPFDSKPGFHFARFRSLPLFFKAQRGEGLPWFYTNIGLQYTTTAIGEDIPVFIETSGEKYVYRFHCFQLPLQLEYKFYKQHGGGSLRKIHTSYLGIHTGIIPGYQLVTTKSTNESVFPAPDVKANPFQLVFSSGIKVFQTLHGFSLNMTYNRDLIETFTTSTYHKSYFMIGIAWNRLDSECETSQRRGFF